MHVNESIKKDLLGGNEPSGIIMHSVGCFITKKSVNIRYYVQQHPLALKQVEYSEHMIYTLYDEQ